RIAHEEDRRQRVPPDRDSGLLSVDSVDLPAADEHRAAILEERCGHADYACAGRSAAAAPEDRQGQSATATAGGGAGAFPEAAAYLRAAQDDATATQGAEVGGQGTRTESGL